MDSINEILKNSGKKISKLKILSNFYNNTDISLIVIKTEMIHNIFKENVIENLDINKLELFHLQYTDSLIELLSKLKKQKETESLLVIHEIGINNETIQRLPIVSDPTDEFETLRKFHNHHISHFLNSIYQNLSYSNDVIDYDSITELYKTFGDTFFRDLEIESFKKDESLPYYEIDGLKIQRKLLGRLNKNNYKVRFICGFKKNNSYYELFRYMQTDEEFIWDVTNMEFFLIDSSSEIDRSKNIYLGNNLRGELERKNKKLEIKLKEIKTIIPDDVETLLIGYNELISDTNKVVSTLNINEETNILKSMLNLNRN